MTAIKVLVVDDHAVVRHGLLAYISELGDATVVGEATTGEELLLLMKSLRPSGLPDVVLMDLLMPGQGGIVTTAQIKEQFPATNVVVMTSYGNVEKVRAALEAGAVGYLLKDAEPDDVARAIRAAVSGEVYLDSAVTKELTKSMLKRDVGPDLMSAREIEVLILVGRGLSNQDIADALFISERTARTHVSSVLYKLGLKSRTLAALWAVKHGYVSLHGDPGSQDG